jgi:hypothetical protein
MAIRLYGMAEAERQIRVARRLCKEEQPKVRWDKLRKKRRRSYLDRSCQPPHVDEDE